MKRLFLYFAALVVLVSQSSCGYNSMVQGDQNVKTAWANLEGQYQRRTDLFNNVVNTIKGNANYERTTLREVVQARANATSVQLSADQLTPENLQKFQAAQSQISAGIGRLLAVQESYPQLKATDAFRDFQAQIEGTENRIAVARENYNATVNSYNTYIRSFPNNLFSGMFGFKVATPFQPKDPDAVEKAPDVNFGDMGGNGSTPAPTTK